MTNEEYAEAVFTHGRRVANRVVLCTMDPSARTLDDFHACYGPETDLPEHERCMTGLIHTFDPSGRQDHYPSSEAGLIVHEWPVPESPEGDDGAVPV